VRSRRLRNKALIRQYAQMAIDFARRRTVDARSYPGTTTAYAIGFMLAYPVDTAARQVRADYEAVPQRELVLGDGSGLRVNQTFR
jgi:hypothetical protein